MKWAWKVYACVFGYMVGRLYDKATLAPAPLNF
jgi:hypothetical protein